MGKQHWQKACSLSASLFLFVLYQNKKCTALLFFALVKIYRISERKEIEGGEMKGKERQRSERREKKKKRVFSLFPLIFFIESRNRHQNAMRRRTVSSANSAEPSSSSLKEGLLNEEHSRGPRAASSSEGAAGELERR